MNLAFPSGKPLSDLVVPFQQDTKTGIIAPFASKTLEMKMSLTGQGIWSKY